MTKFYVDVTYRTLSGVLDSHTYTFSSRAKTRNGLAKMLARALAPMRVGIERNGLDVVCTPTVDDLYTIETRYTNDLRGRPYTVCTPVLFDDFGVLFD